MARPTLYYHPLSPYARKAYIAVLYRGEDVDLHVIDVRGGEMATPAFRAISPFGKMPALVTDDGPLIESSSIIEWLEERGPRRLIPRGTERVARHWDRIGDLYLSDTQSINFFEPGTPQADEAVATARVAWGLFAERLRDRPFVCGDLFTLGDLSGAIATYYLESTGIESPEPIRAWRARVFEIPAVRQATDEGQPMLDAALERRRAKLATRG